MRRAWFGLIFAILAILLLQSVSFGVHQGSHVGDAIRAGTGELAYRAAPSSGTSSAPEHWMGESCGLCQLQREVSASTLILPAWRFVLASAPLQAPRSTGPPPSYVCFRLSARAPPATIS